MGLHFRPWPGCGQSLFGRINTKKFSDYNPIAIFAFYLLILVPVMFFRSPQIICCSLFSGLVFNFVLKGRRALPVFYILFAPVIGALANGIFNHRGATALFVVNNSPITLESLLYGLFAGAMIASALVWFATFSEIMTADKLLYIFGGFSPKIALILSMALRYIPMYRRQTKKTRMAQKALGAFGQETAMDKLHGELNIFSGMATWALENGVISADSMEARGYGIGKRSYFAIFKWTKQDAYFLIPSAALFAVSVAGYIRSGGWVWYPEIAPCNNDIVITVSYICFLVLTLLPVLMEIRRSIKWKSLMSEI